MELIVSDPLKVRCADLRFALQDTILEVRRLDKIPVVRMASNESTEEEA